MSLPIPTAYLPPIAYITETLRFDEILWEAFETYSKQTYRNHCSILGPNGRQTLSVPVIKVNGNHTLIRDIRISYQQPWQKIHWRSIEAAYANAPFFIYYRDSFHPYYLKPFPFLLDFNQGLTEVILAAIKVDQPIKRTTSFIGYRNSPDIEKIISKKSRFHNPEYRQVFHERSVFLPNLSIIDCLFNLGPETFSYLNQCSHLR